jgi:stage II sporulation protein D
MGSLKLMRRLLPLVVLLAALALAAGASAKTLFVVKGKGWGHGVGLSQWGAYGMARDGKTWRQIMAHYYRDTAVGDRNGTIRVLLADGRGSVRIGSNDPFKVGSRTHDAGNPLVRPTSTGRIRVEGFRRSLASPVSFRAIDAPLKLNGSPYHGKFVVSVVGGLLRVVNAVGLESYVAGVVTHESLAWWGDVGAQAALKAQAVAARSYALSGPGHCVDGTYCPDTRDQVYGPISSETPNGRAATRATAHKVLLYGGVVARTFFFSSSGGRTAASVDVWGGDPGYLKSEGDPADLMGFGPSVTNPNRSWRVLLSSKELGSKLGTSPPRNAFVTDRSSGRVRGLRVTGSGWSETFSELAEFFRIELGLKSSRFWIGAQSIRSDKQQSDCGRAVRLHVMAHGVGAISVEQRKATSSTWTEISLNKVDATHWRATRHPCVSTNYRVRSEQAVGPSIHVTVSPDVAFNEVQHAGSLAGKVNPLLAGNPVTVQRRTSSGWTLAGSGALQADGSFTAAFDVEEGVYRARVVPPASTGLATGYSPVLHVVTS